MLGQHSKLSITLMTVIQPQEQKSDSEKYLEKLSGYFDHEEVIRKVVVSGMAGDAIIEEAQKDYDLVVLGATERKDDDNYLFSPKENYIARLSHYPTLVVQAGNTPVDW